MAFDISGRNQALSLLRHANSRLENARAKNNLSDPTTSLLAGLSPEKAKELEKQQEESQTVIEQLESAKQAMKKDIKEQRKNAAAMKIQRIKQSLKSLQALANTDPKAAARLAAQLSRELADAVKEYASAGGSSNTSSLLTGMNSTDATDLPDVETITLPLDEFQEVQEQDQEAFREQFLAQIAKLENSAAEKRSDREFIDDVKKIKNTLRSIIEAAKKQLERRASSSASRNIEEADKALQEVEKSLNQISATTAAGSTDAVNILV